MDYLYKITVEIDDEKVLSLQQHDLDAVYKTVREAFVGCNFKEVPTDNKQIAFVIRDGNDSFSEVGIVANALHDSWLGKYLKKMEWYDMSDDSTEDMLREIQEFDNEYGK